MSAIGITQISGKIGGSVFAFNKGGLYVRNAGKPTNPQTAKQTALRSIFGFVTQLWGTLTEEQVKAWKDFAALNPKTDRMGDSRPQTGFNAFVGVNQNRLHSGWDTPLMVPSEKLPIPSLTTPKFIISEIPANNVLDFRSPVDLPADTYVLSVGFAVVNESQNRNYGSVKNKFKNRVRVEIPATAANQPINVDPLLIADAVGDVTRDETVYFQVHVHTADGQKGTEITGKTIVEG